MRGKPPGFGFAGLEHVWIDGRAWRSLQSACYHPEMTADRIELRPTHLTLEGDAVAVGVSGAVARNTVTWWS